MLEYSKCFFLRIYLHVLLLYQDLKRTEIKTALLTFTHL